MSDAIEVAVGAIDSSKPVHVFTPPPDISPLSLSAAATLLLGVAGLSHLLGLNLSGRIGVAGTRAALQLLALAAVLEPIFSHNTPFVVLPYLLLMTSFAAREAFAKPKYAHPNLFVQIFVSLLAGLCFSFCVTSFLVLRPDPWWDAQTMIPVCGMMLGGAVNSLSLGVDKYLGTLTESDGLTRTLLASGATTWEAALPAVQSAMSTGLTPTLNQMSVIGLVSIPGMMTGTVLGGSPPLLAAKYQLIILFLITFTSSTVLTCALLLATHVTLFDRAGRLCAHKIVKRAGPKPKDMVLACFGCVAQALKTALFSVQQRRQGKLLATATKSDAPMAPAVATEAPGATVFAERSDGDGAWHDASARRVEPLLEAAGVALSTPQGRLVVDDASFVLHAGEQLVLSGPSGCGKSTLLRALALLEPLTRGTLRFDGAVPRGASAAAWRADVMYVRQQGGQGLPGTPQDLLASLCNLRVRAKGAAAPSARGSTTAAADSGGVKAGSGAPAEGSVEGSVLESLLESLSKVLEKPWSRLSGGEAQRVYLCLLLTLRPRVLLLDEPTSACDAEAVLQVERLVRETGAAALWITHDVAQAARVGDRTIGCVVADAGAAA